MGKKDKLGTVKDLRGVGMAGRKPANRLAAIMSGKDWDANAKRQREKVEKYKDKGK